MRVFGLQPLVRRGLFCLMALLPFAGSSLAQRAVAGMALPTLPSAAVDGGALPGTQVVTLTVYLAPPAERTTALDSFLAAVQTTGSPQYRQWLTPAIFAQSFGATAEEIAAVQTWAVQQGFVVGTVSSLGTSMALTGTATQMEAALAPGLHAVQMNGQRYMANTAVPRLPAAIAPNILAIDGLNTVPSAASATVRTESGRVTANDLLAAVSTAVETNSSRMLSIGTSACVEDVDAATAAAMHLLLKEAAAEGITTLASSGCNGRGTASYPGGLAEVVSVAVAPGITPARPPVLTESRPEWQSAPGLPQDGLRYEPDLTVSSLPAFESAVTTILAQQTAQAADGSAPGVSGRLGNMAGTLYSIATEPGLYTQPDGAQAGTWEPATGLGMADLAFLEKHYPNGTTTSQLTIAPVGNVYSITYGGTATYNITVAGSAATAPSGNVAVTFSPGGYTTNVTLTNGMGSFSLSSLSGVPAAGQQGTAYTITAVYNGDGTYASASNTTSLYVSSQQLTLSATAASTSGTLAVGGTYIVTVNISATTGTLAGPPTGSLTITPSVGTAQTVTFSSISASATFTATAAGTIYLQVACTGSGSFVCYSTSTNITVAKATPTISGVTISPNPPVANQATTLSATLTGAGGSATAPSGQVAFTDAKGNALCTTTYANSISGTVSCTTTALTSTTSGTVTATYVGDGNYTSASSTGSYTGAVITTKTTLATIASPVVVNSNINLVATITPATTLTNVPPGGTITFFDGTTQIAQQTVANSQTSYTAPVTLSTTGTHSISAMYSGDTNYGPSTSTAQSVVVAAAPSVVLTATPTGNVTYGNNVTLSATISAIPNNGASTLTGSIKFNVNGTDSLTQTVALTNATGTGATAVFPITQALDAGTYTVNLYCIGTNFDCSSFNTAGFSFTVVKTNTTTTLQVIPGTFTAGQSVYATAVIAPAAAVTGTNGVITGTVTFYDNATNVGSFSVYAANGGFQAVSTAFTVGSASDNIVAVYNGDGNNNSSKSTGTTGTGGSGGGTYTTGISVAANPLTALSTAVVTLTATVTAAPASGTTAAGNASGTVYFYDTYNGTQFLLGSASLSAGGATTSTAVLYTSALRDGANVISASFVGTTSFGASTTTTGPTVQITDYTISFTPTSLNLTAGQTGTITAAVNAVNGFTGQVVLGCTAPSGSAITCSFNPTVITTSGLSTLTVTTTVRSAAVISHTAVEAAAGAGGALLLCLTLPFARRRRLRLFAVAVLVVLGSTLGCTNLVNPATGSGLGSGTPAGTDVLTITTSGTNGVTTVRHTYQIPVSVQ